MDEMTSTGSLWLAIIWVLLSAIALAITGARIHFLRQKGHWASKAVRTDTAPVTAFFAACLTSSFFFLVLTGIQIAAPDFFALCLEDTIGAALLAGVWLGTFIKVFYKLDPPAPFTRARNSWQPK
jgi:hypothetical protein